mmetsp:Transcript_47006/g.98420  ORF Transcript_47006/g.98420 Transcript_47006/m.98420 type:complete len:84 (-) Transcript_47006:217-468(-)
MMRSPSKAASRIFDREKSDFQNTKQLNRTICHLSGLNHFFVFLLCSCRASNTSDDWFKVSARVTLHCKFFSFQIIGLTLKFSR